MPLINDGSVLLFILLELQSIRRGYVAVKKILKFDHNETKIDVILTILFSSGLIHNR